MTKKLSRKKITETLKNSENTERSHKPKKNTSARGGSASGGEHTESSVGHFWNQLKTDHRLQIILGGIVVLGISLTTAIALAMRSSDAATVAELPATEAVVEEVPAEPVVQPRHIDGLIVANADANMVPACVMIENAAFGGVRPQAGLSAASVIYEVIVEGGITRLMAVFAGESTPTVGPVRSARDTYLEFASELNCAYTHAGGSPSAMASLSGLEMRDLDGLREPQWFWRDAGKYAPHNLFTSTEKLYEAIASGHSWTDAPTYDSWLFVDDTDPRPTPTATEVNIRFGGSYDVQYRFNADKNYYERWNGGVEHRDSNTGDVLTARNIIIQQVAPGEYLAEKGRVNFAVTGEGKVVIVNEGRVTEGTWKKADRLARTKFYDAAGEEIPLVRGNSWVEIVPTDRTFDWK